MRSKQDEDRAPLITAILRAEVEVGRELDPPEVADIIGTRHFRDAENRAEIIDRIARCKASTPYRLLAEEHDIAPYDGTITIDEGETA